MGLLDATNKNVWLLTNFAWVGRKQTRFEFENMCLRSPGFANKVNELWISFDMSWCNCYVTFKKHQKQKLKLKKSGTIREWWGGWIEDEGDLMKVALSFHFNRKDWRIVCQKKISKRGCIIISKVWNVDCFIGILVGRFLVLHDGFVL